MTTRPRISVSAGESPPHHAVIGVALILLLAGGTSLLNGQTQSVVVAVDARNTALGEASVALHGDPSLMTFNPAGLAGFTGATLSYSRRDMEWTSLLKEMYYQSFQTAVATPVVVLGAYYNRFTYGSFAVTEPESPQEIGTIEPYDHTIGIAAAVTPLEGFSVGLGVKGFQFGGILSSTESEAGRTGSSSWAVLADLGLLYSTTFSTGPLGHECSAGLSLQNFGSNVSIEHGETTSSEQLPRFFRVGLSYAVTGPRIEALDLVSCSIVITGEYRNILNVQATYGNAYRDTYGWGIEVQALEILALRLGWTLANTNSIYGAADTPATRYGIAARVPLRLVGIPLSVSGAYTSIRTTYPGWTGWGWPEFQESLPVFTVTIAYDGTIS